MQLNTSREVARGRIGLFALDDKAKTAFSGFVQKARSKAIFVRVQSAINRCATGAMAVRIMGKVPCHDSTLT